MIAAAHIVLGAALPGGSPPLPSDLGPVHVWSAVYPLTIGDCPAWEFRDGSNAAFVTIQRVAMVDASRAVWIAWVPDTQRGEVAPLLAGLAEPLIAAGVLDAYWPAAVDGTIGAVEADSSANAATVLAAWPSTWRVRLPTDSAGDPLASPPVPPAPPTGPWCIAAGLA